MLEESRYKNSSKNQRKRKVESPTKRQVLPKVKTYSFMTYLARKKLRKAFKLMLQAGFFIEVIIGKFSLIEIPIAASFDGFSTSDSFCFLNGYENKIHNQDSYENNFSNRPQGLYSNVLELRIGRMGPSRIKIEHHQLHTELKDQ